MMYVDLELSITIDLYCGFNDYEIVSLMVIYNFIYNIYMN